jgi:hypothetical protein
MPRSRSRSTLGCIITNPIGRPQYHWYTESYKHHHHAWDQFWIEMEQAIADSSQCPFPGPVVPSHMVIMQAYTNQSLMGWDQLL